jgi:hypothetical protein
MCLGVPGPLYMTVLRKSLELLLAVSWNSAWQRLELLLELLWQSIHT